MFLAMVCILLMNEDLLERKEVQRKLSEGNLISVPFLILYNASALLYFPRGAVSSLEFWQKTFFRF